MKRLIQILLLVVASISLVSMAFAECVGIKDGTLLASDGSVIEKGYNARGYNYQAQKFDGNYCDAFDNSADWCAPYANIELEMKWNDAFLSNQDCDGDQKLDSHYGYASYRGSGAWMENHQKEKYIDENGKKQKWEYKVKIVAAPADATKTGGIWYAVDGTEIGEVLFEEFAIVQQSLIDTGEKIHYKYVSPYAHGFGKFSPKKPKN